MDWKLPLLTALQQRERLSEFLPLDPKIADQWASLQEDAQDQTTVMIMGEFNAGKSTFLNALLGEDLLTSDVTPATAVLTKVTYGDTKQILGHFADGKVQVFNPQMLEQLSAERDGVGKALRQNLRFLEIQLPNELLKSITLIDSPGLNSLYTHHTRVTELFLSRADIALWLFHYRNVETATEVEQLKKLQAFNVKTIGVVNHIDMHDDEEGDLQNFLDYQALRLQTYMDKVIGVSALEALEAKLENNADKYEWSRWRDVDRLFAEIQSQTAQRADRMFNRLLPILEHLDQQMTELRASFLLHRLEPLLREFQKALPAFKVQQLKAMISFMRDDKLRQELNRLSGRNAFTLEKVESLSIDIQRLSQQMDVPSHQRLNSTTVSRVRKEIDEVKGKSDSFQNQVHSSFGERSDLEQQWQKVQDKTFFQRKAAERFLLSQDVYNERLKYLGIEQRSIEKQKRNIEAHVFNIQQSLRDQMNYLLVHFREMADGTRVVWNRTVTQARERYKSIQPDVLANMVKFNEWLQHYEDVFGHVFTDLKGNVAQLESYRRCHYIFDNTVALKLTLPIVELAETIPAFSSIGPLDTIQANEFKPFIIEPIELQTIKVPNIPTPLENPAEKLLAELDSQRRTRVATWVSVAVIGGIVWIISQWKSSHPSTTADANGTTYAQPAPVDTVPTTNSSAAPQDVTWQQPANVTAYLSRLHAQLQASRTKQGTFSPNDRFTSTGWQDFQHFYNTAIHATKELKVTNIEVRSPREIVATTRETYTNNGSDFECEAKYTLALVGNTSTPMITSFSFRLVQQTTPIANVTQTEVTAFLTSFRSLYMDSLNKGDFSIIQAKLAPDGTAYQELNDYIRSIAGKGYSFTNQSLVVDSFNRIDLDQYEATATEQFLFSNEKGQRTQYDRQKRYTLKAAPDGTLQIVSIQELSTKEKRVPVPESNPSKQSDASYERFIRQYYKAFENAFNQAGFESIQAYYDPSGKEYDYIQNYVNDALANHKHMKNNSLKLASVNKKDDQHVLLTVMVQNRYDYQNGTSEDLEMRLQYLVKNGGSMGLVIEEVQNLTTVRKQ